MSDYEIAASRSGRNPDRGELVHDASGHDATALSQAQWDQIGGANVGYAAVHSAKFSGSTVAENDPFAQISFDSNSRSNLHNRLLEDLRQTAAFDLEKGVDEAQLYDRLKHGEPGSKDMSGEVSSIGEDARGFVARGADSAVSGIESGISFGAGNIADTSGADSDGPRYLPIDRHGRKPDHCTAFQLPVYDDWNSKK